MKKSHIKILFVVLVALTFLLFSCSQQAEAPVSLSIQLDPSFVTSVLQPLTNTHTTTVVDYVSSELETRFVPYLRCKVTGAVYQSIEVPLTAFASDSQNFPTLDPITVEFEPIALGKRIRFEVELIDAKDVVFYATSTEIFSIQPNLPPQKVKLQPNSPIVLLEAAKDSINTLHIANDIEDLTNGKMKEISSNIKFSAIPNVFYSNGGRIDETYISFEGSGVIVFSSSIPEDDAPSFTGFVSDINGGLDGGLDFSTGKTWSYFNDSVNYGGSDSISVADISMYSPSFAMDNGEIYFGFSYKPEGSDYDTYDTYYIFKDEFPASDAGDNTPSFINSEDHSLIKDKAKVSISLEPSSDVTPYINDFCVRDGVIYILKGNKKYVTAGNSSYYSTNGCLLAYNANTGDLIKTYGLSDSIPVSGSDVKHLGFPVKFVAIKPQKLVIADAGFNNVNSSSISDPYSNVNRVFSFDLEKKILEHEADLGFSLGGGGSCYCPNLF